MNRKIIGIFVCMLLIATTLPVTGIEMTEEKGLERINEKTISKILNNDNTIIKIQNCNLDTLDQEQTEFLPEGVIIDDSGYAQSFVPTHDRLTRVQIYSEKFDEGDTFYKYYYLAVGSALVGRAIFVGDPILGHEIPIGKNWIEFDHEDCNLIPGNTYYIIVWGDQPSVGDHPHIDWKYMNYNAYPNGMPYQKVDGEWIEWGGYELNRDFTFKTYGYLTTNYGPGEPSQPDGSGSGGTNKFYTYSTSSTDPDNDQIYILFDWGDDSDSGWIGPQESGSLFSANHSWNEEGTYILRAKAKDIHEAESDWSEPLSVSIPKSRTYINGFLQRFLDTHPRMFPLLRMILGI